MLLDALIPLDRARALGYIEAVDFFQVALGLKGEAGLGKRNFLVFLRKG